MSETVLVVAAHPDDEAIGCGGTIARWSSEGREVHLLFLADGETARAAAENGEDDKILRRQEAAKRAAKLWGAMSVSFETLPDNRMDSVDLLDVVRRIEIAVLAQKPSTVLTHHGGDVNIDHRRVHEATLAACRPQPGEPVRRLLFFEVASSTEWRPPSSALPFVPNYYVDLSHHLDVKTAVLRVYAEEMRPFPHPRSIDALEALARWRGATVGVAAAEGFVVGRWID